MVQVMEKIDIRDLSIGDWFQARMVKWDYEDLDITPPMKIVKIEKDCVRLGFSLDDLEFEVFVDDLQPIPITAEVLEKNGLHYAEFGLTIKPKSNELCASIGTSIEINYIHELQHILRLTKTDKEIVL